MLMRLYVGNERTGFLASATGWKVVPFSEM